MPPVALRDTCSAHSPWRRMCHSPGRSSRIPSAWGISSAGGPNTRSDSRVCTRHTCTGRARVMPRQYKAPVLLQWWGRHGELWWMMTRQLVVIHGTLLMRPYTPVITLVPWPYTAIACPMVHIRSQINTCLVSAPHITVRPPKVRLSLCPRMK